MGKTTLSTVVPAILSLTLAGPGDTLAGEGRTAMTPRGASVKIIEDLPQGPGPFPAVVLASGQAGDMTQPLLAALATSLVDRGIAVVRFDWAYRTADPKAGQQSPDLSHEVEDMGAALAFARKDPRIDPARIVLAGKSLGSVVAFRIFRPDPDLKGAVLLTPLCSLPARPDRPASMRDPYPDFAGETRPMALVAGDKDPVCALPALYRMAGAAAGKVRVAVVGGDHGFAAGAGSDPSVVAASRRNLDLAVANAADAAASFLQ